MAQQEAQDEAAKRRIISHMNADHHDSIIRYLEHYHGLYSWTAYDSAITDIDLNGMTFDCSGKTYRIPFDPPMKAYREARERVVEIDKQCLQALGKSDITVKEFVPPTGLYALVFFIVVATFLSCSQRWWFAEGAIVERILGALFARFSWTIQPWLISGMLVLHSSETVFFARNYLRKHSTNIRTAVWWQWAATTFIEGVFAFTRFKHLVAKRQEEKRKQKH
ncbi:hypothetical protein LTR37_008385 [Vermiconidia calcicola]|uniref:Uncharacterized protein n=1 Tax=Vermiconidia calcicola TaxID=1690605 RepID=A0ACC3NAY7_9PEZI|nr:hypothetical protein LTR37_008385 [Vermiconidia calcicola]